MLNFFRTEMQPRLEKLAKLSLFVDLSPRELKIVDAFMHERRYLKDEIVFDEGEEGQAIYIILEGRVEICRQSRAEPPIAVLEPGAFFGELALIDNAPRVAQARAAEDLVVLSFFRGDFLGLMQSHAVIASKIAMSLARHLSARLRGAMRQSPGVL